MPGGGHGRGMWSWWMGGWSWFWFALLVLVIVLLVVWITRRSGPTDGGGGGDDALRILEERFARGEIDREEFEERRRTLRGGPP
jgi:putative membrane protein